MTNAIAPGNQNKKVCIIVPVYNAEKYLGYCLNSILSQTYPNWTAILVDDGSTDASLEICRSYEAVDPRFRVFSKPNGGVSSARNFGLRYAQGDYLEFVDSDDCLAQDSLEKQVALAVENDSQLVVVNALIVDFQNPKGSHVMLNSTWLGQSPCVLSAEEFREKRMRLIWHTALLEGPWAKLYDLSLWKRLDLHFPEDMSLGEDFVTNMAYYAACNKAVFLNECGYYYNQSAGSGSLSEKYRPDLFEVKMYLMERLGDHLGGRDNLSAPERDAFDCYAASNGFVCVEQAVLSSGMDEKQMAARLREMFAHPIFADGIRNAGYIPDRFVACVDPALEGQAEKVIAHIAHKEIRKDLENQKVRENGANQEGREESDKPPRPSGLLNRAIRKCMRLAVRLLGNGTTAVRLTRLEREIAQYGLKQTWRRHARANQRVTRACLEDQLSQLEYRSKSRQEQLERRLEDISARTDSGNAALLQQLEQTRNAQREQTEKNLEAVRSQIDAGTAALLQQLEQSREAQREQTEKGLEAVRGQMDASIAALNQRAEERNADLAARITESVNGHAWIVEQRMTRFAYLRDINELRQRKKAVMLATAEHANIGDAAITLAEQQLLGEQFPDYFQVEISTYEFDKQEAYLHAILNAGDILFVNGGGNMGDRYPEEEELHRRIVAEFPNNRIVIFPQTICFSSTERGQSELRKSEKIYNSHKDLTLFVRGKDSLEFAKAHFARVKTALMPDVVHALRAGYAFDRSGALVCLRDDAEGTLDGEGKKRIADLALKLTGSVERSTNMYTEDVTRDIRGLVVRKELMRFARHQVVVTDRLHGMIFSAVTGTPCVVLSSYNHKIQEYYEAFFRDSNAVFFIGEDMEKLEGAVERALRVVSPSYPVFEGDALNGIRAALENGF